METTENNFTGYDKALADCHLANWGVIYLDRYGVPMEIDEVLYMLELEEALS